MAKKFTQNFYGKIAWKEIRDAVMKRDAWLCVDCMKRGIYKPAEEVHHIIPITPDNINDESITLNMDNLVSLCKDCHHARHEKPNLGERRKRRYTVDQWGNVQIGEKCE